MRDWTGLHWKRLKRARAELERWLAEQVHGRAEVEFGARGRAIITRGTDP